jgi:hypothetical protein
VAIKHTQEDLGNLRNSRAFLQEVKETSERTTVNIK